MPGEFTAAGTATGDVAVDYPYVRTTEEDHLPPYIARYEIIKT